MEKRIGDERVEKRRGRVEKRRGKSGEEETGEKSKEEKRIE